MEELREFCEAGLPITLSSEYEELESAKQLILNNGYQQDPEDPLTYTKVSVEIYCSEEVDPSPLSNVILPDIVPEAEYRTQAPVDRNRPSRPQPDSEWKRSSFIQVDTSKLPKNQQVKVVARIPKRLEKEQKVGILVAIQPQVKVDETNLFVHLHPMLLCVGVPKSEVFSNDVSLGYYPNFIRLSLEPKFGNPSTVALPLYTPRESENSADGPAPAGTVRRTTETTLGGAVGWGPISFTAERTWGTEREVGIEHQKLVPVAADEGNAASFEWSILRWSDGERYNARKPHSNFKYKPLKAPFTGGNSTVVRLQNFPGAVWHLDPALQSQDSIKFNVHLEVEMHLLWFLGTNPFFRSRGSDSACFELRNEFEVDLRVLH